MACWVAGAMRFLVLALFLAACAESVGGDQAAGDNLGGDNGGADDGKADSYGFSGRVCADGPTVQGIDVSYFQGTIDWPSVAADGIGFAFVRLSYGDIFRDPKFDTNWQGALDAGVVRGAYQFFKPSQSVSAQAQMMIDAMSTMQTGDLPPMLDVEVSDGESPSRVAAKVEQWTEAVQSALGVAPIIYSGSYFWRDDVGGSSDEQDNPFWIAQYTTKCPNLPLPWSRWTLWQYSSTGSVSGIRGHVDLDRFNGSADDLAAFAVQ
jgi:lysozyme